VDTLAQLILGLLALALTINLIQGGRPGARQWLRSKFLGQTN